MIKKIERARLLTLCIYSVKIRPFDIVYDLKLEIQKIDGIPPDCVFFLFGGKKLMNVQVLVDCSPGDDGAMICMVLRIGGGDPLAFTT